MSRLQLSRRTVLRGLGVSVALPWLEAMGSLESTAQGAAAGVARPPVRMASFFIPNGVNMENWRPKTVGANFDLPPTLQPFKGVQNQLSVLSGLTLDGARSKGDGPGDHARSAAAFLTGAHPFKTAGANIKLGVSMDQVAAEKIGSLTRLPSLELGLDKGSVAGDCDSGYSCAYVSNISWRSETTPMPKEVDPGALFERLFGSDKDRASAAAQKRLRYRKSILDYVQDDAKRLERTLGKTDQRKLDEFSTAIREIELRVDAARAQNAPIKVPDYPKPAAGIPKEFTDHMRLMMDMLVLAFQMDVTRIGTFMVARDGSNKQYRWLGVNEGHHSVSHHGKKDANIEAIRKIDLYHAQQFAYFLGKLQSIKEGNGTLLDNSMVMIGSGISDGDRHNHDDLPVLLAGRAGGVIKPGRHVVYDRNTPMCNLYLSMLNAAGAKVERFGDSTGLLAGLT